MNPLLWVLCAEGSSDAMLLPIIRWVLRQQFGVTVAVDDGQFSATKGSLAERLAAAVEAYDGYDLFVVHRDADRAGRDVRVAEIAAAAAKLGVSRASPVAHLPVVPVVESEAWLLFNEAAIRRAATNPNGKMPLKLPQRKHDQIADPKSALNAALDAACGYTGRKFRNFQRDRRPVDVANEIADFAPLRQFDAFRAFEADVAAFAELWRADPDAGPAG